MFDHIGLHVGEYERSRAFYRAVMGALEFELLQENEAGGGRWLVFGAGAEAPFFVVAWSPERAAQVLHLAFEAPSADAVDRFHASGIAAGGTDNGAPGPRPAVSSYYAAYLLDPDGSNVEAGFRSR